MADQMPIDPDPRVRFAAERTLLAWVRTGIALMAFGFVLARFAWLLRELAVVELRDPDDAPSWSLALGITLVLLGVMVNSLAATEHLRFLRRHDRGTPYSPPRWSLGVAVAIFLAIVGVAMTAYLILIRT